MLTKLTAEGRKAIMKNPKRPAQVNKEVEAMGAKLVAQYAVLGEYDFVNILEAQNNEVIARVSADLGSRGTLEPTTMSLIPMENYVRELETVNILKPKK